MCTPLILYTGKKNKKKLPICISPGPNPAVAKPLSTHQSFSALLDVIQNENDEEKMPNRFQE